MVWKIRQSWSQTVFCSILSWNRFALTVSCHWKASWSMWVREERAFETKTIFLELQEDDCSYQISLREKLTQVKEVKSGAQGSHEGKETKLQNEGDLESWFFYFIALCVETLPEHHTLLYFYALEVKKISCWCNGGCGGTADGESQGRDDSVPASSPTEAEGQWHYSRLCLWI